MPYQNPMYQNMINPYAQQQPRTNTYYQAPQNNGIIWVQGIEGAKAYQLSPNSNVLLMDSEADGRFYIKVSDNVGMCNLRIFEYKEITDRPQTNNIDLSQYVTRNELLELLASFKGVEDEQPIQPTKSSKTKSE